MSVATLVVCAACASAPSRPRFVPPAPVAREDARPSGAAVGVVLSGGGAFGAWEIGALQAFFDWWYERHGEDPPVRVVAGTSTGALIAPAVFLGRPAVAEADRWYTQVDRGDLLAPKLAAILPFPLFATLAPAPYDAGHPGARGGRGSRLYRILGETLDARDLARIADDWPRRRIGVATIDFGTGRPHVFTNGPRAMRFFREGVFTSAAVPLVMPPISLPTAPQRGGGSSVAGAAERLSPHMDGGVHSVAPFETLLDLADEPPRIDLTHVVLVTPFPAFPAEDAAAPDVDAFPDRPDFRQIAERLTTLLGEATVARELALFRAALALRRGGSDSASVHELTGLRVPDVAPELIVLRPTRRLGWQALRFEEDEMRRMFEEGYRETRDVLSTREPANVARASVSVRGDRTTLPR